MSRRFAAIGGLRRTSRESSARRGVAAILGANMVEEWHAGKGLALFSGGTTIQTWIGQVRGTPLDALSSGQRPAYGADGSLFGGKSVVKPDGVGTFLTNTAISPALWLNGTRPYLYMVARYPSIGVTKWSVRTLNTASSEGGPSFRCDAGNTLNGEGVFASKGFTDTASVHWFEVGLTAAGVGFMGIDGVRSTAGSGATITGDRTKFGVGSNTGAGSYQAISCAHLVACTVEPSAAQIAALVAFDRAEWAF